MRESEGVEGVVTRPSSTLIRFSSQNMTHFLRIVKSEQCRFHSIFRENNFYFIDKITINKIHAYVEGSRIALSRSRYAGDGSQSWYTDSQESHVKDKGGY